MKRLRLYATNIKKKDKMERVLQKCSRLFPFMTL